jgi:hypothetical protein
MPISTIGSAGLDQAANVTLCTTSGNVGIGTALPAAKLQVVGSFRQTGATAPFEWTVNSGAADFYKLNAVGYADNLIVANSSGNVGIGTSSPSAKLNVVGGTTSALIVAGGSGSTIRNTASAGSSWFVGTNVDSYILHNESNTPMLFTTNGSERMRIDSSGNLLVGTTNTSATAGVGMKFIFSVDAASPVIKSVVTDGSGAYSTYNLYSTNAGAYRFFVTTAGAINATSITITAISDQRLKENVRDIDTGLDAIMALKPRLFDWKEGKGQDKKDVAGFIAQEFETVFPECVGTSIAGADGIEYKNINHETLIPTLVKAIQEQQALITQLQADVAALKGA